MTSSFQIRIPILSVEAGYLFLGLNELGEKSQPTIILGEFVKFPLAYSFQRMIFIGQNLKHVLMTYSFLELLIFFLSTLV